MLRRYLPALFVLAFAGCTGDPTGAARVFVSWNGFAPGCVKLSAWDSAVDESGAVGLELEQQPPTRENELVFAVYRRSDWSNEVKLRAEALEGACANDRVFAREVATVTITERVEEVRLTFSARDEDADGFVASNALLDSDCDDGDPGIHPGAAEICDGRDQDCNGSIDDNVGPVWYRDQDQDGYGDPGVTVLACERPDGWVAEAGDCDDNRATVAPGLAEVCDGLDNDCNGSIDEGLEEKRWFRDSDGDGFGDPGQLLIACAQPPGHVDNADDCNDAAKEISPTAGEVCNGIDDDCDGKIDEEVGPFFFRDADKDGYGDEQVSLQACSQPDGYVNNSDDCDDTRHEARPGAAEICNGRDDDCDGQPDNGLMFTLYEDADGDTFGNPNATVMACTDMAGYSRWGTDCNDRDPAVHPNAIEICNGVDDNCNGAIDENLTQSYFRDADGDGRGDPGRMVQACPGTSGISSNSDDCNDGNPFVYAGAAEHCDGLDNDCNGQPDDNVTCTGAGWKVPTDAGGSNFDWRSVSVYSDGKAWSAGRNDKLRHFEGNQTTTNEDGRCSGHWQASWAAPDGTVYLAGEGGKVTSHTRNGVCAPIQQAGSNELRGIVGFSNPNGPILFTVGGDRIYLWQPAVGAPTELARIAGSDFRDVDGASQASLILVGETNNGQPLVVRRSNGSFSADALPSALPKGPLRKVSAVRPNVAFAVGNSGTVVKLDGSAWTALPQIAGAGELVAVKAFGENLVYVVGKASGQYKVWRWDGVNWADLHTLGGDEPRDMDGTSPWDLWVVGNKGLVQHYSE